MNKTLLAPGQAGLLSKTYGSMVRKYLSVKGALTLDGVVSYLSEISSTARPSTVRTTKYALQSALLGSIYDVRSREIIRSTFRRIKTPRPDRTIHSEMILTPDQVTALSTANASPRALMLVKMLSVTGTRLSEILEARIANCEVLGDVVSVRIIGKGKKERRVFLSLAIYTECLNLFKGKTFLLETASGKSIHPSAGRRMVYSVARSAGVKNVFPHRFRHHWASSQLRAGRTLKAVSKYLGHSNVSVTATFYDHTELTPGEALGVA